MRTDDAHLADCLLMKLLWKRHCWLLRLAQVWAESLHQYRCVPGGEWVCCVCVCVCVNSECSSCKWRKAFWMTRYTVRLRPPFCSLPMQFRRNMVTMALLKIRTATWPTIVCCPPGIDNYLHLRLTYMLHCCCRMRHTRCLFSHWDSVRLCHAMHSLNSLVFTRYRFLYVVLCRVFEQHALSKEEWQDKVINWHMEHKGLMRYHSLVCLLLVCDVLCTAAVWSVLQS